MKLHILVSMLFFFLIGFASLFNSRCKGKDYLVTDFKKFHEQFELKILYTVNVEP